MLAVEKKSWCFKAETRFLSVPQLWCAHFTLLPLNLLSFLWCISFLKLRFVDLILKTRQFSIFSVCPLSHEGEGYSDGAPGASSSQVSSETELVFIQSCFFHWETAEVVYWLEREACSSGAAINCCVYPRSAAVCVCLHWQRRFTSLVITLTQQLLDKLTQWPITSGGLCCHGHRLETGLTLEVKLILTSDEVVMKW